MVVAVGGRTAYSSKKWFKLHGQPESMAYFNEMLQSSVSGYFKESVFSDLDSLFIGFHAARA